MNNYAVCMVASRENLEASREKMEATFFHRRPPFFHAEPPHRLHNYSFSLKLSGVKELEKLRSLAECWGSRLTASYLDTEIGCGIG